MENATIKGTSVSVIKKWVDIIISKIPNNGDEQSSKSKHFNLDPESIVMLNILKDIFPDVISALNSKEPKDCCPLALKDDLEMIKNIISSLA